MAFHIAAELGYSVFERSSLLLNIHALHTANQSLTNEVFTVTRGATCEFFPAENEAPRYVRIDTQHLGQLLITYAVTAETTSDSIHIYDAAQIPITSLARENIPFLFPSRYCQSDKLSRLAFKQFGHILHPLAQATAVADWIFGNIDYVPGTTDAGTSAYDTITQRAGVCRDFAHLGIALCRALSIPARYFSGYACNMQPPDFHACFEVCVGNRWFVFDPTRMSSPNGLIRIATGRDAADAAVATLFGPIQCHTLLVSCTADHFQPLSRADLEGKAIIL